MSKALRECLTGWVTPGHHIGLLFVASGAVYLGMPKSFSYPAATGDLLACGLAFVALALVMNGSRWARLFVWLLTIEGSIDLISAVVTGTINGAPRYMGASYWIPAILVPALLVGHFVTFRILTLKTARI